MKKNRVEVIIIIALLVIFIKVASPQITQIAEKSRAISAKTFLRILCTAESTYYSEWAKYTDNIEVLSGEYPAISKLQKSLDWSLGFESSKDSFIITLTRTSNNSDFSNRTLTIDQSGKISGNHRYR